MLYTLTVFLMLCDSQHSVVLPHGSVSWLQCVVVVFPDHTHLFFAFTNFKIAYFFQIYFKEFSLPQYN